MKLLFPSTGCCSEVSTQPPGHTLEQLFINVRTPLKPHPNSPARSNVDRLIPVTKEHTGITVHLVRQFFAYIHDTEEHRPAHYSRSCPHRKYRCYLAIQRAYIFRKFEKEKMLLLSFQPASSAGTQGSLPCSIPGFRRKSFRTDPSGLPTSK